MRSNWYLSSYISAIKIADTTGLLKAIGTTGFKGAISGGITAELYGGDFWDGAAQGAIGSVAGLAARVASGPIFNLGKGMIKATIGSNYGKAWRNPIQANNEITNKVFNDRRFLKKYTGIDSQINDNKFGHSMHSSYAQQKFGLLATPLITIAGLYHEIEAAIIRPGHVQGDQSDYTRESPFYAFFDNQHPLNWLWDTPGDMLANGYGQIIGITYSLFDGDPYFANKSTQYIPGPDYRNSPWTQIAYPSYPERK